MKRGWSLLVRGYTSVGNQGRVAFRGAIQLRVEVLLVFRRTEQ